MKNTLEKLYLTYSRWAYAYIFAMACHKLTSKYGLEFYEVDEKKPSYKMQEIHIGEDEDISFFSNHYRYFKKDFPTINKSIYFEIPDNPFFPCLCGVDYCDNPYKVYHEEIDILSLLKIDIYECGKRLEEYLNSRLCLTGVYEDIFDLFESEINKLCEYLDTLLKNKKPAFSNERKRKYYCEWDKKLGYYYMKCPICKFVLDKEKYTKADYEKYFALVRNS